MVIHDDVKVTCEGAGVSASNISVPNVRDFANRMFNLSGFMLSEEHRGKPAVTITFPDSAERDQFLKALVDLSKCKDTP